MVSRQFIWAQCGFSRVPTKFDLISISNFPRKIAFTMRIVALLYNLTIITISTNKTIPSISDIFTLKLLEHTFLPCNSGLPHKLHNFSGAFGNPHETHMMRLAAIPQMCIYWKYPSQYRQSHPAFPWIPTNKLFAILKPEQFQDNVPSRSQLHRYAFPEQNSVEMPESIPGDWYQWMLWNPLTVESLPGWFEE